MPEGGVPPILCAHLLHKVDDKLIELLTSLGSAEWDLQTIAPQWTVRDVAAHLLDTALRKLSMVRDGCFIEPAKAYSQHEVVTLVDSLNREGVKVYRRLSPRALIDLMAGVCDESARFHESLDPFATAVFNVSWAGEDKSLNWFDTARELTERWHHQQQIRLATQRPGIMTRELYHPVLDCFLRGLPHVYKEVAAPLGTLVDVEISGECGGEWFLAKAVEGWRLVKSSAAGCVSHVTIPQQIAWRVFTKGLDRELARAQIQVEGDRDLGETVLRLTAIVG